MPCADVVCCSALYKAWASYVVSFLFGPLTVSKVVFKTEFLNSMQSDFVVRYPLLSKMRWTTNFQRPKCIHILNNHGGARDLQNASGIIKIGSLVISENLSAWDGNHGISEFVILQNEVNHQDPETKMQPKNKQTRRSSRSSKCIWNH